MSMDLRQLAEPFPAADVEWRVARAGTKGRGVYCLVIAYITARAIQERLDAVCGPHNWRVEEPRILNIGKPAFSVGISIRIDSEWVTKWDVSEPTNIEPAKGGFSGAMKRAGAQWGIGRYLYHLEEVFAETADTALEGSREWNYAKLPKDQGTYFWKTPSLPAWALPKEEQAISPADFAALKKAWRVKFAKDVTNPKELRDGFSRFVESHIGWFPMDDVASWTRDALDRCLSAISATKEPHCVASDVPFEE